MTGHDEFLGMDRRIPRRDFLQGMALGVAGLAIGCTNAPRRLDADAGNLAYPPGKTGLRGQDMASMALGHRVRDGAYHELPKNAVDTGEEYDLVVVGAGLSGLAAAHVYQKQRHGKARILILDNHDDFGGHARRNTFHWNDTTLVAPGGTFALESPEASPPEAQEILNDLGVDAAKLKAFRDPDFKKKFGLSQGVFFDPKVYPGIQPKWVKDLYTIPYAEFFAQAPLSEPARKELIAFYTTRQNYLPDNENLQELLSAISWETFIRHYMKLGDEAVRFANLYATDLLGLGCDAVSALDGFAVGPGFAGMGGKGFFEEKGILRYAYEPVHRYPDGNHTIARHLLKKLIPQAVTGKDSMEGVFNSTIHYGVFDRRENNVRLRLRSVVVRVEHENYANQAGKVMIHYSKPDGRVYRVQARSAIVTAWGMVAKHIVPELSQEQKAALQDYRYTSAIYINVLLRHWRPVAELGLLDMFWPDGYCTWMHIADPLRIGRYQPDYHPDKPTVLSMYKYLYHPGLDPTEQMKLGRLQIEEKLFFEFEREIREALNNLFGPWGFNATDDILAITVNRWGHGYNFFKAPGPYAKRQNPPYKKGREKLGRISFAGADAGGTPWTQMAFKQAWRAAHEQLKIS
jgi:spermidine dehydrogenase